MVFRSLIFATMIACFSANTGLYIYSYMLDSKAVVHTLRTATQEQTVSWWVGSVLRIATIIEICISVVTFARRLKRQGSNKTVSATPLHYIQPTMNNKLL